MAQLIAKKPDDEASERTEVVVELRNSAQKPALEMKTPRKQAETFDSANDLCDDHRNVRDRHVVVELANRLGVRPSVRPSIKMLSVLSTSVIPAAKSTRHKDCPK